MTNLKELFAELLFRLKDALIDLCKGSSISFFALLSAVVMLSRINISVDLSAHGRTRENIYFRFRINESDLLPYDEIFKKNIYDQFIHPLKGDVVFDVGANSGIYALKVSKQVGKTGVVVAIEPNPEVFRWLSSNIQENNGSKIILLNAAAASKNCSATLSVPYRWSVGGGLNVGKKNTISYTVRCLSLDNVAQFAGFPNIIKIDVEGAELDVLQGAKLILSTSKPQIVIETHPPPLGPPISEIVDYLTEMGYECKIFTHRDILLQSSNCAYVFAKKD